MTSASKATITAEQVRLLCRAFKMPGLMKRLDELMRQAEAESWSAVNVIEHALSTEVASREESSVRLRVREARFPDVLTIDTFDFALAPGVDKAQVLALARGTFVDEKQNIVFVGPVGTGKTHLATALGVEVARQRRRVTWYRAADLVRTLIEAKGSRELGQARASPRAQQGAHRRRARLRPLRSRRRRATLQLALFEASGVIDGHHLEPELLRVAQGLRRRREAHRRSA